MAASQFAFKTASETAAALAAKTVSAVELTQATIDRIEKYDAKINAICVRISTARWTPHAPPTRHIATR